MKQVISVFLALALIIFFSQCTPQSSSKEQSSATDQKADEAALLTADSGWSVATGSKNSAAFSSYLMDDVVGMAPNAPVQNGKDAFTKLMEQFFAVPGFFVKWQATKAVIAKSGDIGYTYGAYNLVLNDSTGKQMTDTGKYSTVWKKQTDGSWKVAIDIFNSDLPEK